MTIASFLGGFITFVMHNWFGKWHEKLSYGYYFNTFMAISIWLCWR
jgi:hypothetical protein